MNSADNEHDPQTAVTAIHAAPTVPTLCDECSAPVEEEQRYCVVCGAHRRHVEDPASRYLSELTARSRTKRAATVARPSRAPARGLGLGLAVALALVPAAAAVGVVAERSSNNGNAKLIQALVRERAAANADATTTSGSGGAAAASTGTGSGKNAANATSSKKGARSKTAHHGKKGSKSTNLPGSTAITAAPSKAQQKAGAQATQKVQSSKGKNYVNSQKSLPGTVVVP